MGGCGIAAATPPHSAAAVDAEFVVEMRARSLRRRCASPVIAAVRILGGPQFRATAKQDRRVPESYPGARARAVSPSASAGTALSGAREGWLSVLLVKSSGGVSALARQKFQKSDLEF